MYEFLKAWNDMEQRRFEAWCERMDKAARECWEVLYGHRRGDTDLANMAAFGE